MRFLFLVLVLASVALAYNAIDDSCLAGCCAKYNGILGEVADAKVPTCLDSAKCLIVYNGATKGSTTVACVELSYKGSDNAYSKSAIGSCISSTCGSSYVSPNPGPWNTGDDTPEPEKPKPKSVCDSVSCPSMCKDENEKPILYFDGRCVEDNKSANGYYCGYTKGQCIWRCRSDGTNCDDADPLTVSIDSPADGAKIDTGKNGYATVDVSGTVGSASGHTVSRVIVTSTSSGTSADASFDSSSNRFTLNNVRVDGGRPAYLTATAYDAEGRRLGTKSIVVYPSPKMIMLNFNKKEATLLRNGAAIGGDWTEGFTAYQAQEGDEFEISGGSGSVIATYSDGTIVEIKPPCRIRFYNKGIELIKGAVEVEVSHDYQVLGRLGYTMVKGTRFKVIVPEDTNIPESVIVLRGAVESGLIRAPGEMASVGTGQHLYVYPGIVPVSGSAGTANAAEMLGYGQGGQVTTPDVKGATPSGGGSCCGSAFVLGLVGTMLFVKNYS
jgi:hypothetical protein